MDNFIKFNTITKVVEIQLFLVSSIGTAFTAFFLKFSLLLFQPSLFAFLLLGFLHDSLLAQLLYLQLFNMIVQLKWKQV